MFIIYIYPDNLRAKPKLWLWELRDVAVIGIGFLFSVLALANGAGMLLMILTVLYAFLSIRMEGASILDFLRCAVLSASCSCTSSITSGNHKFMISTHIKNKSYQNSPAKNK